MLASCEFMLSHLIHLTLEYEKNTVTLGQIARAKANCTRIGREVVSLAREICGGNGIILDNHVMKAFMDSMADDEPAVSIEITTQNTETPRRGKIPKSIAREAKHG